MLHIKSIPAFRDNYIWLIENSDGRCAVVDPGDAKPVIDYLTKHKLELAAILITHHHADHIGGVAELKQLAPSIDIIGPAKDGIRGLTQTVAEGDQIELFGQAMSVLELPGHTSGHIGYYGGQTLFCGDVLFSAGCGRVFEGTMEQMYRSLQKLAALPTDTKVYCAHEYTSANLAFALAVEPDNPQLHDYRDQVNRLRAQEQATIPTQIGLELTINPFLRCDQPSVIQSVANRINQRDEVAIFSALREWKNDF
ncbi:hydroxyacylglutathione hydrolase [Vibrio sp.]|uniref:hydroxyacylglutathione hydrolase n=1 Tax=Vibrio sp. TaxID=678 RepID=UPI003D0A5EAB